MEKIGRLWNKPEELQGFAAEFYYSTGKTLVKYGVLTELDKDSFISLCRAYSLMRASLDAVEEYGVNVEGRGGEVKKNPALTTYKAVADTFHKLARRFYLTPTDREGVEFKPPQKYNEKQVFFI